MNQSTNPMFSVVIPAYNYAHYLLRSVGSVLSQGGDDYEAIVVDDGSTDSTAEVVKDLQAQAQAPVLYVHQRNGGPSAARNRGIEEARGDFVLFLDADDALYAGALTGLRATLRRQPSVDFILGSHVLVAANGKVKVKPPLTVVSDRNQNFRRYLRGDLNAVCCGSVAVRRSVLDRLRFPGSDMMWEDIILWAHLLALYDGIAIPDPLVTIYRHAHSLGHNQTRIRHEYRKPLDFLFDSSILTADQMMMRTEVLSIIYLQQFTFLYKRRCYEEAKALFLEGIRAYPRNLLRIEPLRRYLSLVLGIKRTNAGG